MDKYGQWISVKDKLPEEYENVIIFTDYDDIDIDYLVQQKWSGYPTGEVTHWMPLPEPPEE